eukprot:6206356-Prymnesium_polylepis.2
MRVPPHSDASSTIATPQRSSKPTATAPVLPAAIWHVSDDLPTKPTDVAVAPLAAADSAQPSCQRSLSRPQASSAAPPSQPASPISLASAPPKLLLRSARSCTYLGNRFCGATLAVSARASAPKLKRTLPCASTAVPLPMANICLLHT